MNPQKQNKYDVKRHVNLEPISETSSTSVYSTCSNSFSNNNSSKEITIRQNSLESFNKENNQEFDNTFKNNTFNNESSYFISPLELNIPSDDDLFEDCPDSSDSVSKNEFLNDEFENTKYISYEMMSRFKKLKLNSSDDGTDKKKSKTNDYLNVDTSRSLSANSVIRRCDFINLNNTENYLTKAVDNGATSNIKKVTFDKSNVPESSKSSKKLNYSQNCSNHNTTESFVLWEQYCEVSENLNSTKSCSYSDFNNVTNNYDADNECSAAVLKSLIDTSFSACPVSMTTNNLNSGKKSIYRSKSCDSLLKEVKHLPYVLYDRFLKCLSVEIENMRKQKVKCTCLRKFKKLDTTASSESSIQNDSREQDFAPNTKKKENLPAKNHLSKPSDDKAKASSSTGKRVQTVSSLKVTGPFKQNRLSPVVLKDTRNVQKSPTVVEKSPLESKKKYNKLIWQKEVVSPVGEYIRGKRPSPYKNSSIKKKI